MMRLGERAGARSQRLRVSCSREAIVNEYAELKIKGVQQSDCPVHGGDYIPRGPQAS